MDISVEELLLLENLTYIDSNFREAIGKDLDIASYKTVGQMLDQFTPEVMDKLIQCGDQTVDGGLTSGYEWAAMIQSMKNNPNLCSLKIDRESTAMHGGDAGKTKAICFVKPDGKAIVAFRGTLVKTSGRIMCMEELELEPEKARALLRSPCPLSDVYKEFRDRETEHKLSAYTCICCGKPATRITLGWISPFCDDCVPKGKNGETTGYYESMPIWSHGR